MKLPPVSSQIELISVDFDPFATDAPLLTAVGFDPFANGELLLTAPATLSQQEIWLAVKMGDEANCAYNESLSLRLRGELDLIALESALQQLVQRHEALRINFSADGQTLCIVATINIEIPVTNLTAVEPQAQATALAKILEREQTQPFDIEYGPLFRAQIVKLSHLEHLLVITAHHVICDGWAWGVLNADLGKLYTAIHQGIEPKLAEPARFSDYAILQAAELNSPEAIETERYWLEQFAGEVPIVDFPTDRPRQPLRTFRVARQDWQLPPELVTQLQQLGTKFGCSFMTMLLAGFEVWLHRMTGQADLVVGVPAAGQVSAGQANLVGHCVNFLPLRTQIDRSISFADYLQIRRSTILDAYEHQQFTLGSLMSKLALPRDASRVPLVPIVFNLDRSFAREGESWIGLEVEFRANPHTFGNFELFVNATELRGQIVLEFQYNTDLFDAVTIRQRMAELETLLCGIIAAPVDLPIAKLPLLTIATQQQLRTWNATQTPDRADLCIHQLFEAQVDRTPDAVAVVFNEQQLTYRELNDRSNQLARHLQTLEVKADVIVGIYLDRSCDLVVGLLGILKAGGAYLPLDPAYPQDRLAYMLENSQVKVAISSQQLVTALPKSDLQAICLDSDWQQIERQHRANLGTNVERENSGYIIYTSGSTGVPKGVAMTQRALCNLILWQIENTTGTERAKTLQFTPISFDVSFQEIFSTLCAGGELVLVADEVRRDPFALLNLLEQQAIDRLFLPFVALQQLAEVAVSRELYPQQIQEIITAGEQLQITPAIRKFFSKLANCTLHNHYGPSESHVVTAFSLTAPVENWSALPPIGRPIANTQIYLLDSDLQLVPIGVAGEMYIGGDCLAKGYFNRPDLTAERFIPDPFSQDPDLRLYKTGDLARYLHDGEIEYLGRIDHQVKIRGFRIELGEVETLLGQHPAIEQITVIVREDRPGDKQLVAYIVADPAVTPTISELQDFIAQKVPNYMVPATFVLLSTLPITPSGKVDRRALPVPEFFDTVRSTAGYVAPRNSIEEQLVAIWAEVLKLESVSIYDNFFELGGHSLLATQMVMRIEAILNVSVSLRQLLIAPTIDELAKTLCDRPIAPLVIPRRSTDRSIALSFPQQRLWFLAQLDSSRSDYHLWTTSKLTGDLNIVALQQALDAIVSHHEVLRTNFISEDNNPIQVIRPPRSVELLVVDLTSYPPPQREIEIKRRLQQQSLRNFDLERDLMLRGYVLQIGSQEQILLLIMHHIATDGWSMGIFTAQLQELYAAFCEDRVPNLPELPIQYADFSLWQKEWLQAEVLGSALDYWQHQMASAPALLMLPTDRPRPVIQSFQGSSYSFTINRSLTSLLDRLSRRAGVTLFMTLFAAFDILLYRYTGSEDLVVGVPIANRNRPELAGLIGFFVNTLALRTDVAGNPSFLELLARVKKVAVGAYEYQDFPFDVLVDKLQPQRDLSYSPIFQVMFAFEEDVAPRQIELRNLIASPYSFESQTAQFDLTLLLEKTAAGLVGTWNYNTDLFDARTIERMANHFQMLLEGIVTNPEQSITTLTMLTAAERDRLLVTSNNTQTDYPRDRSIHQIFEQQVELNPDRIAIVFEPSQPTAPIDEEILPAEPISLTYRQLNDRANQLAHHLKTLGVTTDVCVGISVQRSVEMLVGILGILKAGGAYVPLDPTYPHERLHAIVAETQLSVILTQQLLLDSPLERLRQRLPPRQAQIVVLDAAEPMWARQSTDNLASNSGSMNLAYVMYTSGSTGQAKGVSVIHRGVVRLVKVTDYASFTANDVSIHLAPISFDASTLEIWSALLNGGKLVIFPPHQLTLAELGQIINRHQVSTMWLTAGLFHEIVDRQIEILAPLRQLLAGGDVLSPLHVQKFLDRFPTCQLINGYGPTENTVFTTCYRVTAPLLPGTSIPIGRPIANTQVYILDEYHQPVPDGVAGELYTGGDGITRGYFNRPELTAAKFIPDPFNRDPAARLYRTGDLARYRPDGNIEFLGRIDHQVKINGFRIELGEIETVLSQHPEIAQITVIVREDRPGDKRLVAYYVATDPNLPPTVDRLRDFIAHKVPSFMVPGVFVRLAALPMTANSKIDRRSLPVPDSLLSERKDTFVAPRNETEIQLAEIWRKALGLNSISMRDNFFELGGNSLIAVRLFADIEKIWGRNLPLATLFQAQTIEVLATIMHQKALVAPWSSLVPIQPKGDKPPLFCIHPIGGNVLEYYPLANYLGDERPIYGLQSQGLDGKQQPFDRVEKMASHYVNYMLAIQPEGAYSLLGYSFGGLIAFEIAQQLHDRGKQVTFLGLVDLNSPNLKKERPSLTKSIEIHLRNLWQLPNKARGKYIKDRIDYRFNDFDYREFMIENLSEVSPINQQLIDVLDANFQASENYTAKPYAGDISLFRCQVQTLDYSLSPDLGWGELADGNLKIYDIPSIHYEILREPGIQFIAEKIKSCLEKI
jgi:surfactin family lipopeptide synthetase A